MLGYILGFLLYGACFVWTAIALLAMVRGAGIRTTMDFVCEQMRTTIRENKVMTTLFPAQSDLMVPRGLRLVKRRAVAHDFQYDFEVEVAWNAMRDLGIAYEVRVDFVEFGSHITELTAHNSFIASCPGPGRLSVAVRSICSDAQISSAFSSPLVFSFDLPRIICIVLHQFDTVRDILEFLRHLPQSLSPVDELVLPDTFWDLVVRRCFDEESRHRAPAVEVLLELAWHSQLRPQIAFHFLEKIKRAPLPATPDRSADDYFEKCRNLICLLLRDPALESVVIKSRSHLLLAHMHRASTLSSRLTCVAALIHLFTKYGHALEGYDLILSRLSLITMSEDVQLQGLLLKDPSLLREINKGIGGLLSKSSNQSSQAQDQQVNKQTNCRAEAQGEESEGVAQPRDNRAIVHQRKYLTRNSMQ